MDKTLMSDMQRWSWRTLIIESATALLILIYEYLLMNENNIIFPNIGNRKNTCRDFLNDDASRMSSRISKSMPETAQQKYPSLISQDGHFVNGYNGIHSNTHK